MGLGFYPTPFHRLSAQLGVEIYLKREDLSGFSPFGGNKIRKLEYLLGDALKKGCDHVITFGAIQSNHAMQTVAACRKCGLKPILFLNKVIDTEQNEFRANLLLDHIMGSEIYIMADRDKAEQAAREKVGELEKKGHSGYVIPGGGASAIGSVGFIEAFLELLEQPYRRYVEENRL